MSLLWDPQLQNHFDGMIEKVPVFMRSIARDAVLKKLEDLVTKDNRGQVTEKDMVDAFFAATPFGFHGPMKTDLESFGIDYAQYGYQR